MLEFSRPRFRWLILCGLAGFGAIWLHERRPPARPSDGVAIGRAATPAAPSSVLSAAVSDAPPAFARGALFATLAPPQSVLAALDAALPAPSRVVHYVRVNTAWLAGKSSPFWQRPGEGRVTWPLPDGRVLTVVIDASEMLGSDRFTSTGHLAGRPASRAIFAFNEGFLHATVDDAERGAHVLRVATAELSQCYQVDPALVPPCGGERRKVVDGAVLIAARERQARAAALASAAQPADAPALGELRERAGAVAENPQSVEVHVMMAVTQNVLSTLAGAQRTAALVSAFDASIARVNRDLAASLVTARVKLVKVAETTYDEMKSTGNKVQDEALTALQGAADGQMDELHALRDQSGADLVCLVLNRSDFSSSGLAFVIDTPGDTTNALFAFSVVQYFSVAGTSVIAHEFGHSFGCAHDRENAFVPGAYGYSYGYRFFGADGVRYRDIMAYPPGVELGYFSNPSIIAPAPINVPVGLAEGRAGESDTARTIEQAAFEVSTYRLQTQTKPNLGTLVNVSTSASLGPGERAVIAGFTVEGSQPKAMLVRAAGPALAAFGVRAPLATPVLELYAGPTRLAENSGWSAQPGAAAVSAATLQAGAFPFVAGSADAALLLTLPPGGYTAVVSSESATGVVLVEAYESGPDAGRIVNLATRAYADNRGRPIVAGFVVRGSPAATKRVLVRVRGPSLARPPFNVPDAMDDPFMEIRNAAGQLILRNDDWSTGAVGGASAENDFTPLVRYYHEKQFVATGLAPANRREPCLMADLPPGSYTVIVMPFELLPDEPARPGVALVEVFEIGGP